MRKMDNVEARRKGGKTENVMAATIALTPSRRATSSLPAVTLPGYENGLLELVRPNVSKKKILVFTRATL